MANHAVHCEKEWVAARKELLMKEKQLTRLHDELSRERRELPWVKVEKPYVFDGPDGKETLAELFGGKSQVDRPPLHVQPRLGGRMRRVFLRRP